MQLATNQFNFKQFFNNLVKTSDRKERLFRCRTVVHNVALMLGRKSLETVDLHTFRGKLSVDIGVSLTTEEAIKMVDDARQFLIEEGINAYANSHSFIFSRKV